MAGPPQSVFARVIDALRTGGAGCGAAFVVTALFAFSFYGILEVFIGRHAAVWVLVIIPVIALPVFALTTYGSWRLTIERQRRTAGQCIRCGYDLRASAGRCPECGRAN